MGKGEALSPIEAVKEFAKILTNFVGKYSSFINKEFEKFFGVKIDKICGMEHTYKEYERAQAIYALNKFVNEKCKPIKTVNIDEEKGLVTPSYEQVRIGRNEYEKLLTVGEIFFKWKRMKMILSINFKGDWQRRATIYFRVQDSEKAEEFVKKLREFMQNYNLLKGEKLVFLKQYEFDFLEYPDLDWDDVILKEKAKEEIILNTIFPLDNETDCIIYGIPWRRGLLFGGIAGTGKTQVCRVLCNKVPEGVTVIWATPKALYETTCVSLLFEAARYLRPTLLIIEDIDFIGTDRSIDNGDVLGELLTQLDGNDPNHGVFVVATTNRPQLLDIALANRPSRFDVKMEFKVPDSNERIRLIKLFTKNMKFENVPDYGKLSAMVEGLTGAHIKEAFVHAQLTAMKDGREKLRLNDIAERINQFRKKEPRMAV